MKIRCPECGYKHDILKHECIKGKKNIQADNLKKAIEGGV